MYALRNMFSWPDSTLDRCLNLILWGCIAYLFYMGYRAGQDAGIGLWGLALPAGALVLTFLFGVGGMYLFDNYPTIVSLFLAFALPFIYYSIARDHPAFIQFAATWLGSAILAVVWVGFIFAPHYFYDIDQRRKRAIEAYLAQQSEAPEQTDTKTLAAQIVAEFPIPDHIRRLFEYPINRLLEDAASVPGWSFETVKPIITKPFLDFLRDLEFEYVLPTHPTVFSVPLLQVVKNISPATLWFSSPGNMFPRLSRNEDRKARRWTDKDPKTFEEQMDYWLSGTPMSGIFYGRLPYELPTDLRFSGVWLPLSPGLGKTNILNGLIKVDLEEVAKQAASLLVIDSKDHHTESLIEPWRNVKYEPNIKVHVFDPDDGVQINLFSLGEVDQIIDLFEYMFSSLLETMKLTDYQSLLLTKCVLAVKANRKPSILALHDILSNGWEKYERGIRQLPPHDQDFFLKERPDPRAKNKMVCDFDSSTYHGTRNEVRSRLDRLLSKTPALYQTLSATETRIDLRKLIDEGGNVIIVNASTKLLGDRGSEFWQRLWTLLLRNAADHRKTDKPVYVYWDEADIGAKNDLKLASLLDKCRSAKIAMHISHQGENQITEPSVRAALQRCAIKFESTGKRGIFTVSIRGTGELELHSNLTNIWTLPRLTYQEATYLKEDMRRRYGAPPAVEPDEAPKPERFKTDTDPTFTDADVEIIPPGGNNRGKLQPGSKKDEEPDPTKPSQY